MKRGFLVTLAAVLLSLSQASAEIVKGSFQSKILGHEVIYSVYLPKGYSSSEAGYPAVYILHGLGNDGSEWTESKNGNLNELMDRSIEEKIIKPAIMVVPFADDRSKYYYINSFDGKRDYEDMFYKELIPEIEKSYKVKTGKEHRGIIGVSMGGYGALLHAMKYPDMFNACAAFSPAIRTDKELLALNEDDYNLRYGGPFGVNLKGEARISDYYKQYDILRIVERLKPEEISRVKFYINCGDVDIFTIGCCLLHIELTEKKIPHVYNMGSGGHEWAYWKLYELDGLKFVIGNLKE